MSICKNILVNYFFRDLLELLKDKFFRYNYIELLKNKHDNY